MNTYSHDDVVCAACTARTIEALESEIAMLKENAKCMTAKNAQEWALTWDTLQGMEEMTRPLTGPKTAPPMSRERALEVAGYLLGGTPVEMCKCGGQHYCESEWAARERRFLFCKQELTEDCVNLQAKASRLEREKKSALAEIDRLKDEANARSRVERNPARHAFQRNALAEGNLCGICNRDILSNAHFQFGEMRAEECGP